MPSPSDTSDSKSSRGTSAGRKPSIAREDVIKAAIKLLGPHRSVSTLSLREVAREAGIAPNSFYRQFRDMDELSVALIDRAGTSLRQIIGEARQRAQTERSIVRASVDAFIGQLGSEDPLLPVLLREGTVGSDAFKQAVDRQLTFFEDELRADLVRLASVFGRPFHEPGLAARAVTRLVFAMGAVMLDQPKDRWPAIGNEMVIMVRMILKGAQALAVREGSTNMERASPG